MKMKRTFITMLLAAATIAFAACTANDSDLDDIQSPDETPDLTDQFDPDATLTVYGSQFDFSTYERDSRTTRVVSNRDWKAVASDSWIHAKKEGDQKLTITVDESDRPSTREGTVEVKAASNAVAILSVRQLGYGKGILLSATEAQTEANGGVVTVSVTTNCDVAAEPDVDWVREQFDTRASHPEKTKERTFLVAENGGDKSRTATITFREDVDGNSDFEPVTFTISQKGFGDYAPGDPGPVADVAVNHVQVKPTSATESEAAAGHGIELTYDGRYDTYYTTDMFKSTPSATLTYYFDNESISIIKYTARKDGSTYGSNWSRVTVSYQSAGSSEWTTVGAYSFNGDTTLELNTSIHNVAALRFVTGGDNSYVSAAEMEFFKLSDEVFDYSTLFTDRSCSVLRDGVTDEDIAACKFMFYRNIARWLKAGTYNTDFRVGDFKAYESPDRHSNEYGTMPVSLIDNPTGMVVNKDEEVVVLAELHGRTNVFLRVVPFYTTGWGGRQQTQTLKEGLNILKMPTDGHVYVDYHFNSDDWRTAEPVRIHFASGGKVNGYYDSQNPEHKAKGYRSILNAATNYRTFDAVGRYVHLVYERSQFSGVRDLDDLLDAYDEMLFRAQIFNGQMVRKNQYVDGDMRHNRVMFYIGYGNLNGNMFTSHYYICVPINNGAVADAIDNVNFRSERCQIAVHEFGHQCQFAVIRVGGDYSEFSNNIMQQYVVQEAFNGTSRLVSYDAYLIGWNKVLLRKNTAHHTMVYNYSYEALAPFWQLELYFGYVKGMSPQLKSFTEDLEFYERLKRGEETLTDDEREKRYGGFYPHFYQALREYGKSIGGGLTKSKCVTTFAVEASRAAKTDLTKFFENWGFFTSGKTTAAYNYSIEVDPNDIAKAKADIAAMGYPEPEWAIEYISDNNWTLFRDEAKVKVGTITRNGNTLTFNGCENAIVYEVCQADGSVIAAFDACERDHTPIKSFDLSRINPNLPGGLSANWVSGNKVKAVQYDGTRFEIPVN